MTKANTSSNAVIAYVLTVIDKTLLVSQLHIPVVDIINNFISASYGSTKYEKNKLIIIILI